MYKIIDSHVHIFPQKIAQKATDGIGTFYDIPMHFAGNLDTLLKMGQEAGINHYVVQSVATTPAQVQAINNFISETASQRPHLLTGLGTLHPDFPDLEDEISRIQRLGLKGVKLHPDFQKFAIDDPAVYPIYDCLQGTLPLLIHTGDPRHSYSNPYRLAKVLKEFPRLTVIAAHFGGWSEWEIADEYLGGTGVYVDTSSSLYRLTPERAKELISVFGEDRVLFGTDFPMWGAQEELERLYRLDLPEEILQKILHLNAQKLFDISL